jgi:hypothetical protein
MTAILEVEIGNRVVIVEEGNLHDVTAAELRRLGMTRTDLLRCFAEGIGLMREVGPGARCRPVAYKLTQCGEWMVGRGWYSPANDPLMQGDCGRLQ